MSYYIIYNIFIVEAGVNILRKPRKLFPTTTNKLFPKSDA